MDTFTFRKATLVDLPTLLKFEQCIIEAERPFDPYLKAKDAIYYDLDDLVSSDNACLMIAEDNEAIVASAYAQIRESKPAHIHQRHVYLGFIYVEPNQRGKGLAGKLIDELLTWGENKGLKDFQLEVYDKNESAIKAYEKLGFEKLTARMTLSI